MYEYILTSRTLTYAQRIQKILEKNGLRAAVTRTPQGLSQRGCGYSVKMRISKLEPVFDILGKMSLMPEKVFLLKKDGKYEEVIL